MRLCLRCHTVRVQTRSSVGMKREKKKKLKKMNKMMKKKKKKMMMIVKNVWCVEKKEETECAADVEHSWL